MTRSLSVMRWTTRLVGHWRAVTLVLCAAIAAMLGITRAGIGAERWLAELSAAVRHHPASGKLHIVEVDARSIAAIDRWPWPRSQHARLVDRLHEAGAASIAFDVDFSARSTAAEDAALAHALERADGGVVLPTFRQAAGAASDGWVDALPAPALRDHANLAAVSVLPDPDGVVRSAPIGTVTAGTPRPSLSAIIAGRAGAAGEDFAIDYAIDPSTIPRHSFIDIRDGRVPASDLAGKQILIGATAIEMGDRYAVPNYGVIPGVAVQALAAETLMRGVPVSVPWPAALLIALAASWGILRQRSRLAIVGGALGAITALFFVGVVTQAATGWIVVLVPAMAALLLASCVAMGAQVLGLLHHRRVHDSETGLPNRHALVDGLAGEGSVLIAAARIAEFERIAAGLSRDELSELVRRVSARISLLGSGATIYRIGERVVAWEASTSLDNAAAQFERLRAVMLSPIEIGGRRVDVSLTVGIAEGQRGDAQQTIAHAAHAAEIASTEGSGLHIHAVDEEARIERELSLLSELDDAVAKGELLVLYQPKLDLAADRIASVEALVRWKHPTRGFLSPDLFIPLAERNDRIAGLTLFVLEQTIADLKAWNAGGHKVTGAVNLSANLLSNAAFNARVSGLVEGGGLPPELLTFEVTESAAMLDPTTIVAALAHYRSLGIAISMDDYGTGQSTLTYLKRLPLNELKIDRSFVQHAHQNRSDGVLVRSTIELAHELGLKVVAEGVEDEECLSFLRDLGCDMVQGYLIGKPMPAADLAQMIAAPARDAA